jgi:hypothetical protein
LAIKAKDAVREALSGEDMGVQRREINEEVILQGAIY